MKLVARLYVAETNVCFAYHKKYATRNLAVRHLGKAKSCSANIVRYIPPISCDLSDELDTLDSDACRSRSRAGKNTVVSIKVCRRLPGPLRPFDDEDTLIGQLL